MMRAIAASWRAQAVSVRVLRVFLAFSFIYAGIHKASDPGFFTTTETTSLARTLEGFATISPIAPLLEWAGGYPTLAAWGVVIAEVGIGVFTLLGVAPALTALAGALASLTLWLAASWTVRPFYYSADPAYLAMWVAYLSALVYDGGRRRSRVAFNQRSASRALLGVIVTAAVIAVARIFG
jgi:thiosulfate dehydrogenase (quinone) large subunit